MENKTLSATIHLTHLCNLRCTYCYTGEKLPIAMSYDILDESIDFILAESKKQGIKNISIIFFGGEPLIEKSKIFYAIDRMEHLSKKISFSYSLSTNGTLITEDLMTLLVEKGVFVSLSIDGNPKVHDKHRIDAGGHSTSSKVAKAIKIMLYHNPCTNATCVISPDTAKDLMSSINYIYEQGIKYITTTLDYSAQWTEKDFKTLQRSYKKLANWYEQKMISEERFYLSFFDERIRTRTYKPIKANEKCGMGELQFSIAPNGELYPCIQFVKTSPLIEYMIGHVSTGFDQKCQSNISCKANTPKLECQGCALESRCSKWCSCINFMSTGSIEKASPIVCYNEKILIEIVDKTANKLWKKRNNMFVHKHYNPNYSIISHLEINIEKQTPQNRI